VEQWIRIFRKHMLCPSSRSARQRLHGVGPTRTQSEHGLRGHSQLTAIRMKRIRHKLNPYDADLTI
jgi:hypothetical protein